MSHLCAYRIAAGSTVREMSALFEVTPVTWLHWEKGTLTPPESIVEEARAIELGCWEGLSDFYQP